jgi:hypothetical protein
MPPLSHNVNRFKHQFGKVLTKVGKHVYDIAMIKHCGERTSQMEQTSIRQLFEDLPISIRKLAEQIEINEVTLARIRDGKATSRPTANKLLMYFSDLYRERYNLRNVTGINIPESKRGKEKTAVPAQG